MIYSMGNLNRHKKLEVPFYRFNVFNKDGDTMVLLFHYLSILNIFDGFVTFFGLHFSLIEEMNPLMNQIYEVNPVLFILTKLTLSVFIYMFIFLKVVPNSNLVKGITIFASSIYTGIFMLHCYWIVIGV